MTCRVCAGALVTCFDGSALGSVSSDCRPWSRGVSVMACGRCGLIQKPDTGGLGEDVAKVYEGYDIYRVSGGEEHRIFTPDGVGLARSRRILDALRGITALPARGRLLDIGCGNGATLRTFGEQCPAWELHGFELDDHCRETVSALPNVAGFHSGSLKDVEGGFDLVTFIHVLEHIPSPHDVLVQAARLVRPGGLLVVHVPDVLANPFDMIVVDHFVHFTAADLRRVLVDSGFDVTLVSTQVIQKEIMAVASPADSDRMSASPAASSSYLSIVRRGGDWLHRTHAAVAEAARSPRFGIFGTAIAGTWLGMAAGAGLACFVDEDDARVGRTHLEKPVRHPRDLQPGDRVFLAFPPTVARALEQRLTRMYSAQFVVPPEER